MQSVASGNGCCEGSRYCRRDDSIERQQKIAMTFPKDDAHRDDSPTSARGERTSGEGLSMRYTAGVVGIWLVLCGSAPGFADSDRRIFNVRDFGANGDSITDDSVAIASAAAAAAASAHGD